MNGEAQLTAGAPGDLTPEDVAHGGVAWSAVDVRGESGMRLYRAVADEHWILAKDGRPDHRIPVRLA